MVKVQCPGCSKWFDSMTAITQHAESQGVRCAIRKTNGFRQFMDQLTAGLVDTAGRNEDGTVKYTVPDEAREVFGGGRGKGKGKGMVGGETGREEAKEGDGLKSDEAKEEDGRNGEETTEKNQEWW